MKGNSTVLSQIHTHIQREQGNKITPALRASYRLHFQEDLSIA